MDESRKKHENNITFEIVVSLNKPDKMITETYGDSISYNRNTFSEDGVINTINIPFFCGTSGFFGFRDNFVFYGYDV